MRNDLLVKIGEKIDAFVEEYILDLLVNIPLFENRIRSYRLGEKDIKAMSKKGYTVYDADKGRFVKPSKEFLERLQTKRNG